MSIFSDILLLITVKSAINHFIQRDVIRNTWAQNSEGNEKVNITKQLLIVEQLV